MASVLTTLLPIAFGQTGRSLLILTALTFAAWSQQPAQQQTQQPIVVKVEMPPANPWAPVIPGIIGAITALTVLWVTLKHQRRLEFHKADLAAKYKTQDNRWAFRKDVYVNLLNSLTSAITSYKLTAESKQPISADTNERLTAALQQFNVHASLAPLAGLKSVQPLIQEMMPKILNATTDQTIDDQIEVLVELRERLSTEGGKDLWDDANGKIIR